MRKSITERLGPKGSVKRVLVAGLCGVGDLLFFLPALKALRSHYKGARFDLLVLPNGSKSLFEASGLVNSVEEFSYTKWAARKNGKVKGIRNILDAVVAIRRRKYDLCIWPYGATTFKKQILTTMLGARVNIMHEGNRRLSNRAISSRNYLIDYLRSSHGVERNLELVKHLGVKVPDRAVSFPLNDEDTAFGKEYIKSSTAGSPSPGMLVGFHPGGNLAYNKQRQWEARKFAELADRISERFGSISFFFGSKGEKGMIEEITGGMKTGARVVTDLSLNRAASVMKNMDLFIGNDSALVHLASSLGVSTLAVNGPTDFRFTGPWGEKTFVVRLDLPCSPCYSYNAGRSTPCTDNLCLAKLDPDDVFLRVEYLLGLKDSKKDGFLPVVFNIRPDLKGQGACGS